MTGCSLIVGGGRREGFSHSSGSLGGSYNEMDARGDGISRSFVHNNSSCFVNIFSTTFTYSFDSLATRVVDF